MPKTLPIPSQAEALEIVSSVLNQLHRQKVSIAGYKDTYAVAAMLDRVRAAKVEAEPTKHEQALADFGRETLAIMGAGGDWSPDTLDEIGQEAYSQGLARTGEEEFEIVPAEEYRVPTRGARI